MARSKTVYNGILNRWVFGATADNRKSAIFKDGYDDPTFMTFKVEFGEWGASILNRRLVQGGITEFGLSFNDYDQLPMGLLNCPYEGMDNQDAYWQTNAADNYKVFNNTKFYSAFQYLRSRNEDTRAKYLYYFVNGLYEIQHDYPFIFKKISGLNNLEKVNSLDGQRLKTPAKITVECYEGLDLKIRTLFEFYRKAAWDDVYQRWILPENMREFKMIIYVFERRIFQDVEAFTIDNQKYSKMSFGKLNADIPVKAYECAPCEFDISDSMSWNDNYSSSLENAEETSKLVINVKNVKTYFKNNLFNTDLAKIYNNNGQTNTNDIQTKIDSIMIYDLVEEMERNNGNVNEAENVEEASTTPITNLTVNGAKAMFLDKRILLENEEANLNIKSYVWGHSAGGAFYSGDDAATYAISISNQKLIGLSEHDTGHDAYQQMVESYADYYMLEDNERYRGGWTYSLAQGTTYDPTKSFWQNLGDNVMNVLTGARRLMLISGAANIQFIPNCLFESYYMQPTPVDAIFDNLNPVNIVRKSSDPISSKKNERKYNYRNLDIKDSLNPVKNVSTSSDPIQSENSPEYDYKNLSIQDSLNPVLDIEKDPKKPIVSQHDMKYYRDRYWVHNKSENPVNEVKEPSDPIISKKDAQYNYDNNEYRYLPVDDKLNELSQVKEPSDSIQSKSDQKYSYENLQPKDSLNPVNEVKTSSDPISSKKDESKYNYKSEYRYLPVDDKLNAVNEVKTSSDPIISKKNIKYNYNNKKYRYLPVDDKLNAVNEVKTSSDPIISQKEPQYEYQELKPERKIPSQEFSELNNRDLPEQDIKSLNDSRVIPEQEYRELDKERELKEQSYTDLKEGRNIDVELMDLLLTVRSLPAFKDMTMEDIRKIPKQDLLELKEAEERSVPIYNADKSVLLESIKDTEGTNVKLLELDKDNKTIEDQALEILQQNKALQQFKISETPKESSIEKADKLKNTLAFTQDFVNEHDKIKQLYVNNIMEMKSELTNITRDIVNKLPINDTYIVKKGEEDHNNINSALMSQNDVDQLKRNMAFLSINDNDIEKLSFQTLITIQDGLNKELEQSKAVVGLTSVVKDSVATNPNSTFKNNAKNSVIKETKNDKMDVIY